MWETPEANAEAFAKAALSPSFPQLAFAFRAANWFGVRYPKLLCGRSSLYSTFRSGVFAQLGQSQRAMGYVRLDAGSEYAAMQTAAILLGQGKLAEARQATQRASESPLMGRDLIQACIDPPHSSQCDRAAQKIGAAAIAGVDVEPRYSVGALLSYCGQKDAALRLLRSAVAQNYCAYTALQTDPLLVKLRGTPEFSELLSGAKQCQNRFLAQRDQSSH
jgi:hypothetical protein